MSPTYGYPVSTFNLKDLLSDTDLSNYIRSSEVPDPSSTWVLAGSVLAASEALPGLGITSQVSSFPAQLTWAFPVASWKPWVLALLSREV